VLWECLSANDVWGGGEGTYKKSSIAASSFITHQNLFKIPQYKSI
jgi:hypothetical protein